jgi:predicted DCC family thiol-disulfide oxidoreductase YuxK
MNSPRSVIVFDGVCHLCNGWVRLLLKHDTREQFLFAPMQFPAGRRLLQEHGLDPNTPVSFLLLDKGAAYTDTGAIVRILRKLGGGWTVAGGLISVIPRILRDPIYRAVARHRYRIFGRRSKCMVPTSDTASRFIRD